MVMTINVFHFTFILLIVVALPVLYLHYRFLYLLRVNHIEKWKEIGSPTLILNNTIRNNIAILKFLKNKEYLKLHDKKLSATANFLWKLGGGYIVLFIIIIIFLFAY